MVSKRLSIHSLVPLNLGIPFGDDILEASMFSHAVLSVAPEPSFISDESRGDIFGSYALVQPGFSTRDNAETRSSSMLV